MAKFQRKIILINKNFQYRFAFFVCSWILALSLLYPLIISSMFDLMIKIIQNKTPDVVDLTPERIADTKRQVVLLLGVLQAVVMGVTFLISIFLSHRIAGPLHKLKLTMKDYGAGLFKGDLKFRKNDHFQDVADTFNEMTREIKKRNSQAVEAIDSALPSVSGSVKDKLENAKKSLLD